MSGFIVVAALMAAIAASAVAYPLLRQRGTRVQGAVAGLVLIGAAALLYPRWSNWDWNAAASAAPGAPGMSPDVMAMVGKLEARMRADPGDLKGWLMLGRSYIALDRFNDAMQAYEHALHLDAGNVEAMLGLGEAMSLRAGGTIPPAAAELFEKALTLAPDEPKALLYAGFSAAMRGDSALARSRWQAVKNMHPPPQIEALIDQRMAELGPAEGAAGAMGAGGAIAAAGAAPSVPPAVGAPAAAATAAGAPGGAGAEATVQLSIAPALRAKLGADTPLFVFAREPGIPGPPLAVKRLTSAAIGTQIHLSAADSMVPGRALTLGQRVSITARVSFSGQPLPAAGDLYGELTYEVGHDGVRDLVIDRVAQ